jgi:serine/threonine protein kinase
LNILKRLDNQHIVKYHDTFEENSLLCIVTEYCSVYQKKISLNKIILILKISNLKKGGSLSDFIINKRKTESKCDDEQIFKWIKELINGLYYLRKNNVIHRDIKPE